jgi:hypothetical protein
MMNIILLHDDLELPIIVVVGSDDLGCLGGGLASFAPEHGVEAHDDEHGAEGAAEVQPLAEEEGADHGHDEQHEGVEDGGKERAPSLDAPGQHHQHDARRQHARVHHGQQPDVEQPQAPLRHVPVVAEREGHGLDGAHHAHQRRARVVERVLPAQPRLQDQPQRVEEAAAGDEHGAHHDPIGGAAAGCGRRGRRRVVVSRCREVDVAGPRRDVGALVEGEQHGAAHAEECPRDLGLAGEGAEREALVPEDDGEDEGDGRDQVGHGGREGGRGQLHAGDVQVLRQRAPARGAAAKNPFNSIVMMDA